MSNAHDAHVVGVIEPEKGWPAPRLRELWDYRDLLWLLLRRNVSVRYRQTAIGAVWAVLQPVALAIVFAVFLGMLFDRDPVRNVPYPVFLICGLTLWLYFSAAIARCSQSTLGAGALISRIYVPRLVIPLAALGPPLVDAAFAFVVLIVAMLILGVAPSANVVLVPAMFLLATLLALGAGLWFSAIVVRFRDVSIGITLALQMMLFASAVIYPLGRVPDSARDYFLLNPLVGMMEGFRWAVLPGVESPGALLLYPFAVGIVLVITGLFYFQRAERSFADVL